jgi:endonuclease-3 related protein
MRSLPLKQLRAELLALRGVGAETADVILVYAFHLASFIVDAYTRTFLTRLGCEFPDDAEIRRFFEEGLGRDATLYGRFHWLVLEHCIARCKKRPLCRGCPFADCAANDHPVSPSGTQSHSGYS